MSCRSARRWCCTTRASSVAWPNGRPKWPRGRATPMIRTARRTCLLVEAWHLLPQGRTDAAVPRLQEATELLAGRGARADEIHTDGVLALACLRRHDEEQARLAAGRAARLIAQAQPGAIHIFEGYASVAEVYLNLWEAGDHAAARPARQALRRLRQYARAFPIGPPRAWLCARPCRTPPPAHHRRGPGGLDARAWLRPNAWRCPASRAGRTTRSAGTCPPGDPSATGPPDPVPARSSPTSARCTSWTMLRRRYRDSKGTDPIQP